MCLEAVHIISHVIPFDNCDTRPGQCETDKLAAIREVWDKWVDIIPILYNPGARVTVDEHLFPFRGWCPFQKYILNKPAKYGINIWTACDVKSSYAWNKQFKLGSDVGSTEKNWWMRTVLDMSKGLQSPNNMSQLLHILLPWCWGRKETADHVRNNMKKQAKDAFLKISFLWKCKCYPKKNKNMLVMSTMHKGAEG